MIKISDFVQEIGMFKVNGNMNLENINVRYKFVPCMKVKAAVQPLAPDKISVNVRNAKIPNDVAALSWNNQMYEIISLKKDKLFCSYVAKL